MFEIFHHFFGLVLCFRSVSFFLLSDYSLVSQCIYLLFIFFPYASLFRNLGLIYYSLIDTDLQIDVKFFFHQKVFCIFLARFCSLLGFIRSILLVLSERGHGLYSVHGVPVKLGHHVSCLLLSQLYVRLASFILHLHLQLKFLLFCLDHQINYVTFYL